MQMKNNQEDYSEICAVKLRVLFFVSSNLLTNLKIKLNLFMRGKHQEQIKPTSKIDENST